MLCQCYREQRSKYVFSIDAALPADHTAGLPGTAFTGWKGWSHAVPGSPPNIPNGHGSNLSNMKQTQRFLAKGSLYCHASAIQRQQNFCLITYCNGLNVSLQNSYVDIVPLNVVVLGGAEELRVEPSRMGWMFSWKRRPKVPCPFALGGYKQTSAVCPPEGSSHQNRTTLAPSSQTSGLWAIHCRFISHAGCVFAAAAPAD